ncbi:unnamed protein product [Cyclocybe aegerita]|uniref:Uncharacterized protein n=1 Tax=Cyclocybe aegerita TaxID=1973307 RepID=A0A8S0W8S7_CYCAE|nr:unnamed protein product [Cyclocybe aegerita]
MTQLEDSTTRSTTSATHATTNGYAESWEKVGRATSPGRFGDDDGDWEDEEIIHDTHRDNPSPARPASSTGNHASSRATPRRRRRPIQTRNGSRVQAAQAQAPIPPPPAPQPAIQPLRVKQEQELQPPLIATEDVINGAVQGTLFTARYSLDVFSKAVNWLKIPLAFLLALWLLAIIFTYVSVQLGSVFRPLCILPGISRSAMCQPWVVPPPTGRRAQRADYPALIDAQSKTFEQLMDESVGGSALSLEIKNAEMATKDLVSLVRISNMKAKDTLARSLEEFVLDAKKTGRGLQKLTAKVGGAVDNIMASNDHALHTIESARANPPSRWGELIPWGPKRRTTDEIVTETFEDAMNVLSNNMQRLIVEAERSYQNLLDLEEKLATLHELLSREDQTISKEKEDLLAQLWTILGGNQRKVRNFDSHLALLKELSVYRKQALAHVTAALMTLRSMSEDMEDMRERVAAPDLLGPSVPVEVHMKSIRMGLERLREGRVRAKRLEEEAVRRILNGGVEGQ